LADLRRDNNDVDACNFIVKAYRNELHSFALRERASEKTSRQSCTSEIMLRAGFPHLHPDTEPGVYTPARTRLPKDSIITNTQPKKHVLCRTRIHYNCAQREGPTRIQTLKRWLEDVRYGYARSNTASHRSHRTSTCIVKRHGRKTL